MYPLIFCGCQEVETIGEAEQIGPDGVEQGGIHHHLKYSILRSRSFGRGLTLVEGNLWRISME